MENKNRIQYALAFSALIILTFQSFSNILLTGQIAYALTYDTITPPASGIGFTTEVRTAVRSGDTIFYLGKITSLADGRGWYNVTAINADTHSILMSTGTCGATIHCSMIGYSQLLPCEGCELTVSGDSVYLYTSNGLRKFNASGFIANTIPCADNNALFHNLHQRVYLSLYDISSFCRLDDKVWTVDGSTLGTLHISPKLKDVGGLDKCDNIRDAFIDSPNKRLVALCFDAGGSHETINLYSYTAISMSDLALKSSLSLNPAYKYLATSGNNYSFLTVTSTNGASYPPLQLSLSDSSIDIFHTLPLAGGNHIPIFIPNPSSPSAIGVLWIYDTTNRLMSGFLPHNSTALGTELCDPADCFGSVNFALPMSYDKDDRNYFYLGGYRDNKIIIFNSTDDTNSTYSIDVSSGNGTNGNGNSTGGTTSNSTCNWSDSSCTITKQTGNFFCLLHIVDCSENNNMATNGIGYLLLALAIAIYIGFVWKIARKRIDSIPTFIWIIGILAIVMAFTIMQVIDPTLIIISIVIIVAFAVASVKKVTGGINVFNRGES